MLDLCNEAFNAYSNDNKANVTGNMVIKIPLYTLDSTTYEPEKENSNLIWTFPLNSVNNEFWIDNSRVPDGVNPTVDSLDEMVWVL